MFKALTILFFLNYFQQSSKREVVLVRIPSVVSDRNLIQATVEKKINSWGGDIYLVHIISKFHV